MKLGTLLLRDAVITLSQLEAALRAQVLYGGRLGTNLVELKYLDLDTLGPYLSEILSVPLATKEHFESTDPALISWFGPQLAQRYTAFPIGIESDQAEDVLAVVFDDPLNEERIRMLATECDRPIAPYVAPELRLYYYLERHYDLRRKARYVRPGTREALAEPTNERRRTQAAGGIEMPPVVRFEPKKKRVPKERAPEPPPKDDLDAEPQLSYRDACSLIDEATQRDGIGHAFVEYAVGRFEAAVVFLLRDANALGWHGYSAASDAAQDAVEQLGLPLGGSSALQAAHDSRKPFRGKSPSAGRPIENRLWEALGTEEPKEMLVVPVSVKRRVVNLVYVHALGGALIPEHLANELAELAIHASDAYVRLIHQAKTETHS